jgi:hypothetical protein
MGGSVEKPFLELVASKGGKAHYDVWPTVDGYVRLECAEGHQWTTLVLNVYYHGHWCKECSDGSMRLGLAEAQKIARGRGGTCLSTTYKNSKEPLRFRCAEGHEFDAKLSNVKYNHTWCYICKNARRSTIAGDRNALIEIAKRHGGEWVSTRFDGAQVPYQWCCRLGHEFRARPKKALRDWCPQCRHLDTLREIAARYGGTLLSTTYDRATTKYQWRCWQGHTFMADKQTATRRFCPECDHEHRYPPRPTHFDVTEEYLSGG